MRRWLPVVAGIALVVGAVSGVHNVAAAGNGRLDRAATLFAHAQRRLASGAHEQRQRALLELEEATRLAPDRMDIGLALGRLYLDSDLLQPAKNVAHRLTETDSTSADAWLLSGEVWRRDWLATVDSTARNRAVVHLLRAARLAPREPRAWALLAPLLVDMNELDAAYAAAVCGARSAPGDAVALAQLAAAAQRAGDLASAERLFDAAVPRLPARVRERYEDITPILPPSQALAFAALDSVARRRFVERFWRDNDPDPVSVENEGRLEFWTRVTQATSLYGTSVPGEWDMRAQYYVRFGRPTFEEMNPVIRPANLHMGDWLAWWYPELGMRVWMGSPSSFFGFSELTSTAPLWAQAWPESLARHPELCGLFGGYTVFHRLPPGMTPLETHLSIARFQSDAGVNVLAHVESPGGPDAQLAAEWVVLDSARTTVRRDHSPMAPSACDADAARAVSLSTTLPPGRYSVGVQVTDAAGRRGTTCRDFVVTPADHGLALSDLVVTCASPGQSVVAGSGIRLEPETGMFPVSGSQLNAYFEIYHLAATRGGAPFEYECSVRPVRSDHRGWLKRLLAPRLLPPPIEMSRGETSRDARRRQFLSIPLGSLPDGEYELIVQVRDMGSGATATASAEFERRGP